MEELLKELQEMSALKDDASLEKAREIRAKYNSSEKREFITKYMNGELDYIENEIKIVDAKLERMLRYQSPS
ncbi:hypothetical protein [Bacteroides faecium]|jgi:hypothetical protein|uniref:Uncharacterized protein n=1 Tax=Bacteroides faecium TaxID=2715212 RepID=A0A6H0KMT1_9BACE|nr:hypothetical protein [Bacteroides faecium]QIU94682.1 hypothetical protein BacF7301_11255 [Bacteroides faecium]